MFVFYGEQRVVVESARGQLVGPTRQVVTYRQKDVLDWSESSFDQV